MQPHLRYFIYGQDGILVPMTCQDTPHMRRFVEWVRMHDRCLLKDRWWWERHIRAFKNWRIKRRHLRGYTP